MSEQKDVIVAYVIISKASAALKQIFMHLPAWATRSVFIYNLKMLAYLMKLQLYTYRSPFHGVGDAAVMFRVLQEQRPKLPGSGHPISPEIWKLVTICWAHQPNKRPQIDQVVQILDRILYVSAVFAVRLVNSPIPRMRSLPSPPHTRLLLLRPDQTYHCRNSGRGRWQSINHYWAYRDLWPQKMAL